MLNCPACQNRFLSKDLVTGICSHCGQSLSESGSAHDLASDVHDTIPLEPGNRLVASRASKDESPPQSDQTTESVKSKTDSEAGKITDGHSESGADFKSEPNDRQRTDDLSNTESNGKTNSDGPTVVSSQSLVIKPRLLVESKEMAAHVKSVNEPEYELIGILGEGGMGIVYDARQTSIDRNVAIKMIKGEAAANDKRNAKFLAEAVVTGELDHPNIVPIYDVGTNSQGHLFYSMKKVQGTPWMTVIAEKTVAENLDILMRTADAVGFAHARGIVHRDLKPENIMLGEFGEVLVMDWGLAYPLSGYRKSKTVIASNSMGGTPAYMSPEMAMGPIERIVPASDIYLLGAILYEIVSGRPPHLGRTAMKCLVAAARNEIAPTDKSGELIDIALRAMASEPKDRYQNVKEFQSAIRDYQSHLESILLSTRAEGDLKAAGETDDYQRFSRALFGFQEAHELWSGNLRATSGISSVKRAYAESAKRKGDIDLGLSLLDHSDPEHIAVRRELLDAQNERLLRQKRLDFLKRAAVGLVATVFVIVTGAAVWIRAEQQKAVAEAVRATSAEQVALSEKSRAEIAAEKEKSAKLSALTAEQEAIAQKVKAESAQKQEEKAKNAALAAEETAVIERTKAESAKQKEEYEAYISKIGLAASQIDKCAFDVAREVLKTCKPELRNWEWGRLMHLCSQSTRSFDAHSPLEALAIDKEGKRFATGGWNGVALIWDRQTGQIINTFKHGGEYVNAVAFSPDGRFLATGGNDPDGFIQIWDIALNQQVKVIQGHDDEVLSIAYSKDGSRLLSSSYDKTARLWDANTGREIRKFLGHTWWVWSAAFSADETHVITAGHDGTAIVWEVASQKRSPPFTGHQGPVFCAIFAPDGKRAVTAGYDRRILAWNPEDIKPFDFKNLAEESAGPTTRFRTFEGHTDAVRSVKFSEDGSLLLSASFDNTVRIWTFETNQALKSFRGHGGRVKAASFVSSGQSILSAAHDNTVREWSISDYQEIRTLHGQLLEGHGDAVLAATYSQDQRQIITASRDRTARMWNAKTGEPGMTFVEGHAFLASTAIFFPGGKRLATAAVDNTARIWDVRTGGQLLRLDHSGRSAALALSRSSKWIATGGDDKSAQLWDTSTGQLLKKFAAHLVEVSSVAFSPDERILATGDTKGHVKLWNIDEGRVIANLDGHTRRVSAMVFLADGSRLLTASSDNTIGQWDVATGRERPDLILKHPDSVLTMQLVPGDNSIATSCADHKLRIWNVDESKIVRTFGPFDSDIFSLSVSLDGKRMLAANSDERTVRLWDLKSGREIQTPQPGGKLGPLVDVKRHGGLLWSTAMVPGTDDVLTVGGSDVRLWDSKSGRARLSFNQHGAVASAHFSPTGDLVVTSSWDNTAKVWDAKTGHVVRKLENGHTGFVNTAVFSPDGKTVLTASDDATAKLWDIASGNIVRTFNGHLDRVHFADFSPTGEYVMTTSSDKTARLWKTDTGELVREFKGHDWAVVSADFSRDGQWVVTGSEDNTACVWNVESAKKTLTLTGHTASVTSVRFSPDMLRIVTGSHDQTAKVWDAKTGQEILTLSRHTEEVTSVAFSPDGRQVLTASRDGTAVIWPSLDWTETGLVTIQTRDKK